MKFWIQLQNPKIRAVQYSLVHKIVMKSNDNFRFKNTTFYKIQQAVKVKIVVRISRQNKKSPTTHRTLFKKNNYNLTKRIETIISKIGN